jgi:uroporphyrinogen decarboxylase
MFTAIRHQQPDMEIIDHFGIDVLYIGRMFNDKDEDQYPITMANGDTAYNPVWFRPELQVIINTKKTHTESS